MNVLDVYAKYVEVCAVSLAVYNSRAEGSTFALPVLATFAQWCTAGGGKCFFPSLCDVSLLGDVDGASDVVDGSRGSSESVAVGCSRSGAGDCAVDGVRVSVLGVAPFDVKLARGPNYERNQANRLRKKQQKKERRVSADADLKFRAHLDSGKYWAGVLGGEEQVELKRSRAEMLQQQNLLRAQQAKDKLARIVEEKQTGLFEKRYEAERLRVESKLRVISERRGVAPVVGGWAQTVVSGVPSRASGSGVVPSLLSGSVSPNSSISVEALVKLEKRLLELETREKVIVAENMKVKAEYARREKVWQSSDDMYNTPDWLRRC